MTRPPRPRALAREDRRHDAPHRSRALAAAVVLVALGTLSPACSGGLGHFCESADDCSSGLICARGGPDQRGVCAVAPGADAATSADAATPDIGVGDGPSDAPRDATRDGIDSAPPDSAPPDSAPPDSAPPDSAPPDSAPPDGTGDTAGADSAGTDSAPATDSAGTDAMPATDSATAADSAPASDTSANPG